MNALTVCIVVWLVLGTIGLCVHDLAFGNKDWLDDKMWPWKRHGNKS